MEYVVNLDRIQLSRILLTLYTCYNISYCSNFCEKLISHDINLMTSRDCCCIRICGAERHCSMVFLYQLLRSISSVRPIFLYILILQVSWSIWNQVLMLCVCTHACHWCLNIPWLLYGVKVLPWSNCSNISSSIHKCQEQILSIPMRFLLLG